MLHADPTLPGPAVSAAPFAPDFELLRKYDLPGPRYTSYPTAPQFRETDAAASAALLEALEEENADPARPVSLYFHLPFCESRCWFCGCTTVITKRHDLADAYLAALARELDLLRPWINPAQPVSQLHFGGGSPTFLSPDQIRRLGESIRSRHVFAPDAEISVEIDPRRLSREQARAYAGLGCRRASLGVQDTDPRVQIAIHRVQPLAQTRDAIAVLRDEGYRSIGVDLIYGLPYQTEETFARTLDEVIALSPDRLAVFSYAHVPWIKPAQKILERDQALPSPETKLRLFLLALGKLTAAGYVHIGMDHFARPDDELSVALRSGALQRNFQGYSTRAGASIHAFGMSSISQSEGAYRQNTRELARYQQLVSAGALPIERGVVLTPEDRRRRRIIMTLMCERRLDHAALSRRLGLDFAKTYAREIASLDDLVADGLLAPTPAGHNVTPLGALLIRVIAMRFDAYLASPSAAPARYSRTV